MSTSEERPAEVAGALGPARQGLGLVGHNLIPGTLHLSRLRAFQAPQVLPQGCLKRLLRDVGADVPASKWPKRPN